MNLEKNKKKVVLIEENFNKVKLIKNALDECSIRTVFSPYRLLASLCAEKPDIILMNSSLNWFSSEGLCGAINKNSCLNDIPILLFDTENTTVTQESVGCYQNCFILRNKNFSEEELKSTVMEIIRERES